MLKRLFAATAIATSLAGPASAETLTIALTATVNSLDPHATVSVGNDYSFLGHIFDSLTRRTPEGEIVPNVATAWELVDPQTWRVTLRDDVTFASGRPLDGEVVKWNLERIVDPDNALRARSTFGVVSGVDVVSPTEVLIRTTLPYPILPKELASLYLLDPAWVAEHPTVSEPSGSGPYELVSFRSGDAGVLRLRDGYWGKDVPPFDEVIFRTIPDQAAQLAALQAGEVDIITGFSPKEIERINSGGKATAVSEASIRPAFVKFNLESGPLSESKELRHAINYAVDKEAIVAAFFAGHSQVLDGQVLSPPYFGYNPDLEPYPYDPAKARELIAESGITPDRLNFELTVPTDTYESGVDISQFIAAQLEEVGINVTINRLDFAAYMTKYVNDHAMSPFQYLSQGVASLEASSIYRLYETGNVYAYVADKKLDELNAAAKSEFDPEKRQQIYVELSEHFRELAPVLFLFTQPRTVAFANRLQWNHRQDEYITAFDFTLATQ